MSNIIIEAQCLSKRYRLGNTYIDALKDASFSIARNSFNVLFGPSGSGKTTLLNILSLIDSPNMGKLFLNNNEIDYKKEGQNTKRRKYDIGIIFQEFNLIPIITVYENIEYVFLGTSIPPYQRKMRILSIMEKIGIKELKDRYPNELSGGQRQRVAIARGLVHNPLIVFADEPTANLDSVSGKQIEDLMVHLHKEFNTTFFISSHDNNIIDKADILWQMKDGSITQVKG